MLTPSLDFTIHSTDFVEFVIVTHGGHRFTAHFGGDVWRGPGRKVVYTREGQWSGEGVWTGTATTDCGADLPEQVYAALDAGLRFLHPT